MSIDPPLGPPERLSAPIPPGGPLARGGARATPSCGGLRPGASCGSAAEAPVKPPAGTALFFYDAHCGFCQRSARILQRLAPGVAAIPARPEWELPPEVTGAISDNAVYLPQGVGPSGDGKGVNDAAAKPQQSARPMSGAPSVRGPVMLGHRAIGAVLATHGAHVVTRCVGHVICARALNPLMGAAYRGVADNRHRLGFLLRILPD